MSEKVDIARVPEGLAEIPKFTDVVQHALISDVLRHTRIVSSKQFCYNPTGIWRTDATPAPYKPKEAIGFHIVASGTLWLEYDGVRQTLSEGDIVLLPFGASHWIGVGENGPIFDPGGDLPPAPWDKVPIMRYGDDKTEVRILCGYVISDIKDFKPFRSQLPEMIHLSTQAGDGDDWLAAIVAQIITEVDLPQVGSPQVLERLTEIALLEVLRREIVSSRSQAAGWLAAVQDKRLSSCLASIHRNPNKNWNLVKFAFESGQSKSTLSANFRKVLDMSPMQYLRQWRLFLASQELRYSNESIAEIAYRSNYGTEASFSRAFKNCYGTSPAAWRERYG
ncbi:AraC family transcriptional regulator [Halocynthiibacter sp. C4]|uniref:AraC family transcriptional regulator n=1 Tax=Halocynthiibacter sp. C4 TaxID=2992758 RepID=UPI00237A6271|nr:AraC family transcriptional regulator [Halocynthiibacter sp. C4]MDE0589896.1 AraC family transcriptional regulator [Halocynthiibacter sp. C4]